MDGTSPPARSSLTACQDPRPGFSLEAHFSLLGQRRPGCLCSRVTHSHLPAARSHACSMTVSGNAISFSTREAVYTAGEIPCQTHLGRQGHLVRHRLQVGEAVARLQPCYLPCALVSTSCRKPLPAGRHCSKGEYGAAPSYRRKRRPGVTARPAPPGRLPAPAVPHRSPRRTAP